MEMTALRKRWQVTGQAAAHQRFWAYEWDPAHNAELHNVESFKYLGRVMSNGNYETPAIRRNLK